jgi:hypothetical protein
MKNFVVFLAIIVLSTSLKVRLLQDMPPSNNIEPDATTPEVGVNTNLTFKDGDIISLESSVIPNVYLAPDVSNCTTPNQPCGQLYGSMESNPDTKFTLKALNGQPDAFCIGRNNSFIYFEAGTCSEEANNATKCSVANLMQSSECNENMAFRINKVEESYAIESVKYPTAYLYFDIEDCRGIMNEPDDENNNTDTTEAPTTIDDTDTTEVPTSSDTNTASNQRRCGSVHVWKIGKIAEMINVQEELRNALFDIMKENEAST